MGKVGVCLLNESHVIGFLSSRPLIRGVEKREAGRRSQLVTNKTYTMTCTDVCESESKSNLEESSVLYTQE